MELKIHLILNLGTVCILRVFWTCIALLDWAFACTDFILELWFIPAYATVVLS